MIGERGHRLSDGLLIGIPLLAFALIYLAPFGLLVRNSLSGFDSTAGILPTWTLEHYLRAATDSYYLRILARTVGLSLAVTAACAILGYPVAYYLAFSRSAVRLWVVVILLMPLVTSAIVVSYGWYVLMGNRGLIPESLAALGLPAVKLLYTEAAIVIGLVHVLLSFTVLATAAALQRVETSQIAAARSLGAGPVQVFLRVILPLSLPGVRTGALLVFSLAMSAYATPVLLGGTRVKVVSNLIYQQATSLLNWPFAAALSVLLLASTAGVLALASAYGLIRQRRAVDREGARP